MKGIIYKIVCNETGEVYYGSTTNKYLCNRMAQHKSSFKRFQNGTHSYMSSFQIIERGNYSYSLIETVECEDRIYLEQRERYYIENNECVNKIIVGRTQKERYEANKDKLKEYNKAHYEANKDAIKLRVRQYSENNREKVLENKRQYGILHKEEKREYDKIYLQNNKEKIRQRQREWKQRRRQQQELINNN